MAGAGLLALIDDITTLLDDVAVMSKVAAKKTVGVLGDDLALNAEQVSGAGIKASRELPIVWAVCKGSLLNKAILVPAALLISAFVPWLVIALLMMGGLYLCYEGIEKLAHPWLHHDEKHESSGQEAIEDLLAFEQKKIRGAIRTDFVLSAEIIVITLGVVKTSDFLTQLTVLVLMSVLITLGVYGLVAVIVKLDDAGLALLQQNTQTVWARLKQQIGRFLLMMAPKLMQLLSVLGMIAMFLVGGSLLVHNLPALHYGVEHYVAELATVWQWVLAALFNGAVGVLAGIVTLLLVLAVKRIKK